MSNIYDKLLLLAALLLLAVGCYIYMSGGDRAMLNVSHPQLNVPYTMLKAEISAPTTVNWSEPQEQSTGWTYDVFTPPKIYLDENGQFVSEGWRLYEPVPFGVKLVNLEKIPYRIQLEGYVEEDFSDASKSLILLYDEETKRSIRTRVGRRELAAEIEVIEFRIDRLRDLNGNPYKEVFVVINDQRSGKTVTLQNNERLYLKDFAAELRSESDSEQKIFLSRVEQEFETIAGKYRLESVDFDQNSVLVYKYASDKHDANILRLKLQPTVAPTLEKQGNRNATDASTKILLNSLSN